MIHELKIKPKFFQDIINGIKNFERFAEEEMLEFDWIVCEFKKQLNRKIKERGIKDDDL